LSKLFFKKVRKKEALSNSSVAQVEIFQFKEDNKKVL
jgi:hypothetical protein